MVTHEHHGDMRPFIRDAGKQLREAVRSCQPLSLSLSCLDEAWLLGMGGSALSGGLVKLLLLTQSNPLVWHIVRGYGLPCQPQKGALALALSYSGNTEETLASTVEAAQAKTTLVAVSRGGLLEEVARERRIPWIRVPDKPTGFQPRFALPYMFGVAASLLEKAGLLSLPEPLDHLADWLDDLDLENQGKELAQFLKGRIPAIYSLPAYEEGVARTWRIKFNENSKAPALSGSIPEINHNEIMGLQRRWSLQLGVLLLDDPTGDPRLRKRFPLTQEILQREGIPVRTLTMMGENPLRRAFHSLMLADYVSMHLAIDAGLDPISIPTIQNLKKKL